MERAPTPNNLPSGFENWPKWKQREEYKNLETNLLRKSLDIPTEDNRSVEEIFEEMEKLNPYNPYKTVRDRAYLENRLKELESEGSLSSEEQAQDFLDSSPAIEENQESLDVKPETQSEKTSAEFQYENQAETKPDFYAKNYVADFGGEETVRYEPTEQSDEDLEILEQKKKSGEAINVIDKRNFDLFEDDKKVGIQNDQKPESNDSRIDDNKEYVSNAEYELNREQEEQIKERVIETKEDVYRWENSEEQDNLENFRMDRILAEDSFKRGQIKQDTLNTSIENYKYALGAAADKIKESLRKEAGENLDAVKEAQLRLKINRTIFEELVEKENEVYLAFLRNERAETTQDKIIEGLKNALSDKVTKWYEGLSEGQKFALNFGSAGLVGLTFDAVKDLKEAEEREIEELKNSNLSVNERAEKLLEIKNRYKKDRIKRTLKQMKENTVGAGKEVLMELVKNVEDRLPSRRGYDPGNINSPEFPPDVAPEQMSFDPSLLTHKVLEGESTWQILESILNHNDRFEKMSEAQKTYVLSYLTNKAIQNPEQYGLNSDGSISMGSKTDFTKMFEDTKEIKTVFNKAEQTITPGSPQEESILSNNQKIKDWVKGRSQEVLDEKTVPEILSDKPIPSVETKPEPDVVEQTGGPPETIESESAEKVDPISQEAQEEVNKLVEQVDLANGNVDRDGRLIDTDQTTEAETDSIEDGDVDESVNMDQVAKELAEAKARLAFLEDAKKK
jgi:hypothetical protein